MKNLFAIVVLVSFLALQAGQVRAASCDLSPVTSNATPVSLQLDYKGQNFLIQRQYSFSEQESAVTATRTAFITFEDFNSVFKRFAEIRLQPKSRCDILRPVEFSSAVDPSTGMAFVNFTIFYEDNLCFPLRFFDPPASPGVTKEPQSYRSGSKGFAVQGAFRPKMVDGVITLDMAAFYGDGGEKIVRKLSKGQLEGFLQDTQFVQMIYESLLNEGFSAQLPPKDFGLADMRFTTNANGKIQLVFTTQKNLSSEKACQMREERLQSGFWRS